jgi:G-patch domain
MISSVEAAADSATVIFLQPVAQSMRLCPHHLDGRCRFEGRCRYSHGHRTALGQLRAFVEPDFGLVAAGALVLAACSEDQLWRRALVESVEAAGECHLKFEASGKQAVVPMAAVWPLEAAAADFDDDSSADDMDEISEMVVERVLSVGVGARLGEWEQYTRGIGSKLMARMGYVTGAGLGPKQEGRVDPVEATVLPFGKSLGKCIFYDLKIIKNTQFERKNFCNKLASFNLFMICSHV